jgi:flagellar FliL protein
MAKAAATTDEPQAPPKGPSLVIQIMVLLVLTLVAAGAGWFSVKLLAGGSAPAEAAHAESGHDKDKKKEEPATPEDLAAADLKRGVAALAPITTNLASPANTWVRIELAAVFEAEPDLAMADAVNQDILAFLRTVKMHQVEGPSGFLHLKEDMDERARIRSGGKISHLLIKTLLFE